MPKLTRVITLQNISAPISDDLRAFRKFFREALRNDNLLLDTALRYIIRRKGKQIRPILVLLSAAAAGGISRRTHIGATLVELLHTATLVHDDVVDEAAERRGLPSLNSIWNNKTAVLVGDYMLAQGLRIANQNREYGFLEMTSEAVQRMSRGELMQTKKTMKLDISEEEYFRIISDKTASLISACCTIGGSSASDSATVVDGLHAYGEAVGIAFQIRDDLFDYVSTERSIGKPIGNDLQEKKLTLPLIHALAAAPRKESKRVLSIIRSGSKGGPSIVADVQGFVRDQGGVAYAEAMADSFKKKAIDALAPLNDSPARQSLIAFAEYVVQRTA